MKEIEMGALIRAPISTLSVSVLLGTAAGQIYPPGRLEGNAGPTLCESAYHIKGVSVRSILR